MMDNSKFIQLYNNVLNHDMLRFNITITLLKRSVGCIGKVYKTDRGNLRSNYHNLVDYNDAAFRCAYLHKHAGFHTVMVRDVMYEAFLKNYNFFYEIVFSGDSFNICCLGGGPGCDAIGVLAAMHLVFTYCKTSVTIIDYMDKWKHSFQSILRELGNGSYGKFGKTVCNYLASSYIGADLMKPWSPEVIKAIGSASLITMIKFISAAACVNTKIMIQVIMSFFLLFTFLYVVNWNDLQYLAWFLLGFL